MRNALAAIATMVVGDGWTPTGSGSTALRLAGPGAEQVEIPELVLRFPWPALRYAHTQALAAALAERYAPATANLRTAALRGVLRECWRLELMGSEEYHRAVDLDRVDAHRLPAGRHVHAGEITALAQSCQTDPRPASRALDGAIIGVAFTCGLRVAELVGLAVDDLGDVDPATGQRPLRVHGKGRRERLGYLRGGALAAVEEWLAQRGTRPGPLFVPVDQTGRVRQAWIEQQRHMTPRALAARLHRRARQAQLTQRLSPHDARRTWIGELLDHGVDLSTVSDAAGHASVVTTAGYDRRGERAKQEAAELLHYPWVARGMKPGQNHSPGADEFLL